VSRLLEKFNPDVSNNMDETRIFNIDTDNQMSISLVKNHKNDPGSPSQLEAASMVA
jgi:hypothetical protein